MYECERVLCVREYGLSEKDVRAVVRWGTEHSIIYKMAVAVVDLRTEPAAADARARNVHTRNRVPSPFHAMAYGTISHYHTHRHRVTRGQSRCPSR